MKRKIITLLLILSAILILFCPLPSGVYKDGGTRTYSSLTYKVVIWNRLLNDGGSYQKTSVYLFPKNFQSIDELWKLENDKFGE